MQEQQQRQQSVQQIQEATQRLASAQSPEEQAQWAQRVRQHATDLSQPGSRSQKTAVTVDAEVPNQETFHQISRGLQQSQTPGLKEVSFRTEGGRNKIRIQATRDALPRIQEVLGRVGEQMQMAYSGSSSPSSWQGQQQTQQPSNRQF